MRHAVIAMLLLSACSRERARQGEAGPKVSVTVVAADVHPGTPLGLDSLAQREIEEHYLSSNVVRASEASKVLGRRSLIALRQGDLLLWSAVESSEPTWTLSKDVTAGRRGMWLEISGPVVPWSYLRHGDRVDVIGTFRDPATNENIARTIAHNLQVLGTASSATSTSGRALAVLVTPEESERLLLAVELGNLSITVRAGGDEAPSESRGANLESLLKPVPAQPRSE